MKKTILTLLLVAISTGAMAEWVKLGESDKLHIYVDPATIRKDGNFRRVWEIQDLKERNKGGEMSLRAFFEYDCNEARSRALSASSHSGPMASGDILISFSSPAPWGYIAPSTISETILKHVCAK